MSTPKQRAAQAAKIAAKTRKSAKFLKLANAADKACQDYGKKANVLREKAENARQIALAFRQKATAIFAEAGSIGIVAKRAIGDDQTKAREWLINNDPEGEWEDTVRWPLASTNFIGAKVDNIRDFGPDEDESE